MTTLDCGEYFPKQCSGFIDILCLHFAKALENWILERLATELLNCKIVTLDFYLHAMLLEREISI